MSPEFKKVTLPPVVVNKAIKKANDFIVISFQVTDRNQKIQNLTAVGTYTGRVDNMPGTKVKLTGEGWKKHPQFKYQFCFDSLEFSSPIEQFLVSMCKGLNPKSIKEVVDFYAATPEKFWQALDESPEDLLQFKGIKEKRLESVMCAWNQEKARKALKALLTPLGVPRQAIRRLYKQLGLQAVETLTANPYAFSLLQDFGFSAADRLAMQQGIAPDSPARVEAAVNYVLRSHALEFGSTVMPINKLCAAVTAEICRHQDCAPLESFSIENQIFSMQSQGRLVFPNSTPTSVAHPIHFEHEQAIGNHITRRLVLPVTRIVAQKSLESFIQGQERFTGTPFSTGQKKALKLIAEGHRTVIVRGPAGAGKTTIMRPIARLLEREFGGKTMVGMALAGVAAQRLQEITGITCGTIHTMLGIQVDDETAIPNLNDLNEPIESRYNASHKLPFSAVILDEASMVSSSLFRTVLESLNDNTILIIVGDDAQLTPIGPGAPYIDLIASNRIPTVTLDRVHRQESGKLLDIAYDIRKGECPAFFLGNHGDFEFVKLQVESQIVSRIKIEAMDALRGGYGDQFQVLSPLREGSLGIYDLNAVLQDILNPGKKHEEIGPEDRAIRFKSGDRVVHLQNRDMPIVAPGQVNGTWEQVDKLRVFNGTLGKVHSVDLSANSIIVQYGRLYVEYQRDDIGEIVNLAYCMSSHKAQGNEFKHVVIPVIEAHKRMLNAKWLYTSITRGKSKVTVVGDVDIFRKAAQDLKSTIRETVLQKLMPSVRVIEETATVQLGLFRAA